MASPAGSYSSRTLASSLKQGVITLSARISQFFVARCRGTA